LLHLSEKLAEGLSAHATGFLKLGEEKGRFGIDESIEDLLVGWRTGRFWRGRVFEHAKSKLVVGSLKGQRHVVVAGGGAVLDGEGEIVGLSLEVEVGITPSMKLGTAAQRLARSKVVRSFSGVVYNDEGKVEQTLEFAEVSQNGGDIG